MRLSDCIACGLREAARVVGHPKGKNIISVITKTDGSHLEILLLTSGLHADETVLHNVNPAHSVFSTKRRMGGRQTDSFQCTNTCTKEALRKEFTLFLTFQRLKVSPRDISN